MSDYIDCEDCFYEERCDKKRCQYDIDMDAGANYGDDSDE